MKFNVHSLLLYIFVQRDSSVAGCQVWLDLLYSICVEQPAADTELEQTNHCHVKMRSTDLDFLATLLMESVCPNVVCIEDEWPEEETLKFSIERFVSKSLVIIAWNLAHSWFNSND